MTNLFLSTTFIPDNLSLLNALQLCLDNNIRAIEIGSNHCFEENYDYIDEFNFEYLVHNYFPIPEESFVLNIASFNDTIRKKSINHIKSAVDFCDTIGAKIYTFHPGFLTDPHGSNILKSDYDFQWDENMLNKANYSKAKSLMYSAIDEIINYARAKSAKIAIESEGSLYKKDHLLMQRPEEYEDFITKYESGDIYVNLNIGHLNLASNAFNFKREDFVDLIQNHIVAMELSHNDGIDDQHLPLKKNGWYWPLITDPRFYDVPKILEFRNIAIARIADNIKLFQKEAYAV